MHRPEEMASERKAGTSGSEAEIPALTGLRFFAAFAVVVAHGSILLLKFQGPAAAPGYWLMQIAGFGMTLFFVLSGFVIHYNYRKKVTEEGVRGLGGFLWARFARLYPLYLFVLVLDVLLGRKLMLYMADNNDGFSDVLRSLPYFLLMIQSWIYVPVDDGTLIYAVGPNAGLTWSISTEWFFYLAYPVIALLILRARRPALALGGILAWTTIWCVFASTMFDQMSRINGWAIGHYGEIAELTNYQDSFFRWLLYFSPYLRIGEFILGCLVAQFYLVLRDRKVSPREQRAGKVLTIISILSVALCFFLTYSPTRFWGFIHSLHYNFALAPSSAAVIFCVARYDNFISKLLRDRRLVALGEASYSIYLIHFLILVLLSSYLGQTLPSTIPNVLFFYARYFFVLGIIILVALGLHAFLEVPARSWLRGLWRETAGTGQRAVALSFLAAPGVAALVALLVANALFPIRTPGAGIRLLSATYGASCGAKRGNVTKVLGRACDGRETCDYKLEVATLGGDPAPGCGKNFMAEYECAPAHTRLTIGVPAEAGLGSHLLLSCAAERELNPCAESGGCRMPAREVPR